MSGGRKHLGAFGPETSEVAGTAPMEAWRARGLGFYSDAAGGRTRTRTRYVEMKAFPSGGKW